MHTVSSVLYLQVMEEAIQRLEKRHKEHIILYDPSGVSEGGGGGAAPTFLTCSRSTGNLAMYATRHKQLQSPT